jgi:ribosomal protein L20A (L18A)
MISLGGQGNYELARRTLGRMRRIRESLGETALHDAYLDDLRSRHKAKRNFIKLLAAGDV